MFEEIDFRDHVPIYMQIVQRVKRLIAAGELKPGDQLPTVRHLAAELQVNFNTVARAYRILDMSGILSTQQGRGTFVVGTMAEGESERVRREALEDLAHSSLIEARRLGFEADEVSEVYNEKLQQWEEESQPDGI
ncbi:MAG: GntR family transcriptional regulator [Anaerolineales bacterium]|nr:GntR family transcriptional regulator [Anaerolineales bacterium]